MTTRTITLTGRPPVKIDEDQWPVIASASAHDYDGQYDFQANEHSRWWLVVRRHSDGRSIVYAKYAHTTAWRGRRDYDTRAGKLLPQGSSDQDVCDTIREVADEISTSEHQGEDAARWTELAAECIADMPAETL